MRIQFSCRCGTRLECSVQRIGQTRSCPACAGDIKVPVPSRTVVVKSLKRPPWPMPDNSSAEYTCVVRQIAESLEFNSMIAEITGNHDLATAFHDEAVRGLRNILVFLCNSEIDSGSRDIKSIPGDVQSLSSTAAGSNFGGAGARKRKLAQHRRWLTTRTDAAPNSMSESPLALEIRETIEKLRKQGR